MTDHGAQVLIETLLKPLVSIGLALAPPVPMAPTTSCPPDMRLVQGTHHEQLQRVCTDFRKNKCWAYLPGLVLIEPRHTPIHTCIDRYEWPNKAGARPHVMMRYVEAEASCKSVGKRLCTEFEWELACEGPNHLPYPYGWAKQIDVCNIDKPYKFYNEEKINSNDTAVAMAEARRLWQGAASGSYPGCDSYFGVSDLVGNVEEWVSSERPEWPYRSSLKGGYWSKKYTGCRGTNESHAPQFRFYEIGFRCCMDPQTAATSSPSSPQATSSPAP